MADERNEPESGGALRVLLADDRLIARLGTAALLGTASDIEVVGQAADGVEAINLYRELKPDVLVLDLRMPTLDGLAVAETLRRDGARARILILSHYHAQADVVTALRAGVLGFISKDTDGEELLRAIRTVARGKRYLPGDIASLVAEGLNAPSLTHRERQVLEQLVGGLTNRDIAKVFGLSPATVALHVKNIMAKLGAKSRTEAVALAMQSGLVQR